MSKERTKRQIRADFKKISEIIYKGNLIIFDKKTHIVHDGNDISVNINGTAIQLTITE